MLLCSIEVCKRFLAYCPNLSAHTHTPIHTYRIVSAKRDLMHVFSRFQILLYSRSLKSPLHIASYALRIGVSVMEL